MDPDRWQRVTAVFDAALQRDPAARAAFLAETCADDPSLVADVQALLAGNERAGGGTSWIAAATDEPPATLSAGTRLGPYVISGPIGAGGMGVVYRARDTKLARDVALKVLTDVFASQSDRLWRFRREAQVLAALMHPNIAAIFGLEESSGTPTLVLELVEGPTLADRLRGGAIPVDEALLIAKQIADALEAAHEKAIMHRDLKPANIKITPDGHVKVLDFGLAKMLGDEAGNPTLSNSPTAMSGASEPGMILGTPAYMSPEQARGQPVNKRTDVWAFGVVLFEMLTGKPAFKGETVTDVLGAIVHKEPDWTKLPAQTPASILRLLHRCLAKDAHQRLHDIADARLEIEAAVRGDIDEVPSKPARRWLAPAGLGLVMLGFIGGGLWARVRIGPSERAPSGMPSAPRTHTVIDLPANAPLALGSYVPAEGFDSPAVSISPNGTYLAYVGQSGAATMLYLRSTAGADVKPVPGTEGAIYAFFSPDEQWLGFLTNDKVKKISLQGGTPLTLSDAASPVKAWWTGINDIYFTEKETSILSRVSADGGRSAHILDTAIQYEGATLSPDLTDVLPDGKSALVTTASSNGISADYEDVALVSLETRQAKRLIHSGYGARYIEPGYIVFARAGALLAVRFNRSTLVTEGEPYPIASGVSMESLFGQVHAAASNNGLLAYAPGGDRATGKLAWVDRQGIVEFIDAPLRVYGVLDLAPNGKQMAVHVADIKDFIWIYDFDRREGRRLSGSESNGWPIWSPDNAVIAFLSFARGHSRLMVRGISEGAEAKELIVLSDQRGIGLAPTSWWPKGGIIAVDSSSGMGFVSLDGKIEWRPHTAALEWGEDFSPDGRWFAYSSQETGRSEIWIRSFPDQKTARQISVDGGLEPVWCVCGELFFRKGNQWLSTRITTEPELRWNPPRVVFETDFIDTPGRSYDVSPDGQRLLVVKRAAPDVQTTLHVITNWFEQPQRKAP